MLPFTGNTGVDSLKVTVRNRSTSATFRWGIRSSGMLSSVGWHLPMFRYDQSVP